MPILSVYIKGVLKVVEIQPLVILELYEQLTRHEIQSTHVFVEDEGFFKYLDATGVISSPVSYPDTGIKCEIGACGNGGSSLHIPLPNRTQKSIRDSLGTFCQALGIKKYHLTFEDLGDG